MKILLPFIILTILVVELDKSSKPSLGENLYSIALDFQDWWNGKTTQPVSLDSKGLKTPSNSKSYLSMTSMKSSETDKIQTNQGIVDVSFYEFDSPVTESKITNPVEVKITLVDKKSGPLPNAHPLEGQLFVTTMKLDEKKSPISSTSKVYHFPAASLRHRFFLLPGAYYMEAGYKFPQPSKSGSASRILMIEVKPD